MLISSYGAQVETAFPSWITETADWNVDVIFLLDAELRFVDCNPGWDSFAANNGGYGILRHEIQGRSILDYMPDILRTFYVHRYWLAKRSEQPTALDYDCSSPEKIRLFRMTMTPLADGLLVVNRLRLEEACPAAPPLTEERRLLYAAPHGVVTMCANCRKSRRRDDATLWEWVPDFLRSRAVPVSHGLCPRCVSLLYGPIDR